MGSPGAADPFVAVEGWDAETARQWAEILDLRATNPSQVQLRADLIAAVRLRPGDTVVEVGSGTGVTLADLADAVTPAGRAIGFEPQPFFAHLARQRLAERGLTHASVEICSAEAIPLGDATVDAAVAQTVLVHVPAAAAALAEMCRVVRPGGRVASIDQDGDALVIDHPDKELTRRLVTFSSDERFADGWTGRRLPRMFRAAGLGDVTVTMRCHLETEPGSFLHAMALRLADIALEVGVLSEGEWRRWTGGLAELAEAGSFFASANYYLCSGTILTL
jgi:ubiquinone/menaquinone biosynthesis C-methylase UbiE